MKKNEGVITFAGNPLTLLGEMVKTGNMAQDFTVLANDLKPHKLSDYKGKVCIISVVPSVDTGVCAAQTRRFNEEAAKLGDVIILTISCDLPFALGRFCAAEGIDKVITLSDHKETDFGLKYGFLIEQLRLLARGIQRHAGKLAAALNWHGSTAGTEIKNRRSTLLGEKGYGLGVCGTWEFYETVAGHDRSSTR